VVPFFLDPSTFPDEVDGAALSRLRSEPGGPVWLYVGRVAPHKAQHVLVQALAVHHRLHGPGARLRLVGFVASGAYRDALESYVDDLGLRGAVTMESDLTAGQLAAEYRAADVFVSASAHEGFGVPLLEAMHHGLPVVAVGSAAIPETVGDAALLLGEADPVLLAGACHRVVGDAALRSRLVGAGHRRLTEFDLADAERRFVAAVAGALENGGAS
jgi:glycosyltransferase involved in cell wall biosynthesis